MLELAPAFRCLPCLSTHNPKTSHGVRSYPRTSATSTQDSVDSIAKKTQIRAPAKKHSAQAIQCALGLTLELKPT